MVIRHDRQWEEMDKSRMVLDALFATYALYNRSEGTGITEHRDNPRRPLCPYGHLWGSLRPRHYGRPGLLHPLGYALDGQSYCKSSRLRY